MLCSSSYLLHSPCHSLARKRMGRLLRGRVNRSQQETIPGQGGKTTSTPGPRIQTTACSLLPVQDLGKMPPKSFSLSFRICTKETTGLSEVTVGKEIKDCLGKPLLKTYFPGFYSARLDGPGGFHLEFRGADSTGGVPGGTCSP